MTGPSINPENSGPISAQHTFFLSFLGAGLDQNWPGPSEMNYVQNMNSKFTFCMQLCSCNRPSGARGNLPGGEAVVVTDLE
jgi:hypothetical protein